uniref:SH3 and cysteine-rich domain-containing protein 3-like isoform X2 n=1 Tax=Myxine glutinosa TaxID=7769 RepID=UPI00358E8EEA
MSSIAGKENSPIGGAQGFDSSGQPGSPLDKFKKTLSFRSKTTRSKSAENVLQRFNWHGSSSPTTSMRSQTSLNPEPITLPTANRHKRLSGPPTEASPSNPSLCYNSIKSSAAAPSLGSLPLGTPGRPQSQHSFQEHNFKKPTFCDVCNHMIVGDTGGLSKIGLRCKVCKATLHHKCENFMNQQPCMGKMPQGFRRHYSSPMLLNGQYACIKEVMPLASSHKLDPVYEALRYGTSLARMSKNKAEGDVFEEGDSELTKGFQIQQHPFQRGIDRSMRKLSLDSTRDEALCNGRLMCGRKDFLQQDTFVALFRFHAPEKDDLPLQPGDRIAVIDDSNEEWWKGRVRGRLGYFPASFVMRVQPGKRVFRLGQSFVGSKEMGQISLKQDQICVEQGVEVRGFMNVLSGRKMGLVPEDHLVEI